MYVQTFRAAGYGELENVALKEDHCLRVRREMGELGAELELSGPDIMLAEATGLLHDVGRFEQYSRYGTFVDAVSVDHARLGCRILMNSGILDGLSTGESVIIRRAVMNHSALEIPEDLDERAGFFLRLLRDADKLDIWRVMLDYYSSGGGSEDEAVGLNLPDTPGVSDEVLDDLYAGRPVNAANLRNQNDFKLLQAGWVYDINFAPSMARVRQRRYLEKLRSYLPDSEEVREALDSMAAEAERRS
jgi:hypothetical protein